MWLFGTWCGRCSSHINKLHYQSIAIAIIIYHLKIKLCAANLFVKCEQLLNDSLSLERNSLNRENWWTVFIPMPRGYDDKFISSKVCNWNETVWHENIEHAYSFSASSLIPLKCRMFSHVGCHRCSASESVDLAVSTFHKSYLFDCEWWNRFKEYCGRHLISLRTWIAVAIPLHTLCEILR